MTRLSEESFNIFLRGKRRYDFLTKGIPSSEETFSPDGHAYFTGDALMRFILIIYKCRWPRGLRIPLARNCYRLLPLTKELSLFFPIIYRVKSKKDW